MGASQSASTCLAHVMLISIVGKCHVLCIALGILAVTLAAGAIRCSRPFFAQGIASTVSMSPSRCGSVR